MMHHVERSAASETESVPRTTVFHSPFRGKIGAVFITSVILLPFSDIAFGQEKDAAAERTLVQKEEVQEKNGIQLIEEFLADVSIADVLNILAMSEEQFLEQHPARFGIAVELGLRLQKHPDESTRVYNRFIELMHKGTEQENWLMRKVHSCAIACIRERSCLEKLDTLVQLSEAKRPVEERQIAQK